MCIVTRGCFIEFVLWLLIYGVFVVAVSTVRRRSKFAKVCDEEEARVFEWRWG